MLMNTETFPVHLRKFFLKFKVYQQKIPHPTPYKNSACITLKIPITNSLKTRCLYCSHMIDVSHITCCTTRRCSDSLVKRWSRNLSPGGVFSRIINSWSVYSFLLYPPCIRIGFGFSFSFPSLSSRSKFKKKETKCIWHRLSMPAQFYILIVFYC